MLIFLTGCGQAEQPTEQQTTPEDDTPLFSLVPSTHSGLTFQNRIEETNLVNYFKYEYLYNGGGVAVGDLNNDGLPDLYLTGNMTSNRLYLNRGDLQFAEVTAKAKASYLNDWCTGVTLVDINHDGWLDIYVSASGYYKDPEVRRNILFVNNGDAESNDGVPTFTDRAGEYGIDDIGYSIQSVFFDYDNDGDLDLYVANHPHLFRENVTVVLDKMKNPPVENSDRLYRNDSTDGQIRFTDVSAQAGIQNYGHTLGLVAADFDRDGFVDIYTSNDYQAPDYFYKNQGDGTFVNIVDDALKHMAKFSMGVDANDFNNDGWTDLMTVEMMAEDNQRQKTNMAPMNPALFNAAVDVGFGYQYMHNALQLNNGVQENDNNQLTFSEIAYLSGVATTDWSWSPLFADFNNDGWKDLFITNGYRRDMLDKDFGKELKKMLAGGKTTYDSIAHKIPGSKLPNYIFANNGDLTFTKKSTAWNLDELVNSNGAAYADLDLDGDLDLVLNNIDTLAFIYQNNHRENATVGNNYLRIKLTSQTPNRLALGAKVTLTMVDGSSQYQELTLTRGYQSSVEPILHFGLGQHEEVAGVNVVWPNGSVSTLREVAANQVLTISDQNASPAAAEADAPPTLFQLANRKYGISHRHRERAYDDYQKQVLLPHQLSQNGPGLAVGDVNGDGLDDFYVGGAAGAAGSLHLQTPNGTFMPKDEAIFTAHRDYEDMGALLLDVDQDGDNDLIVSSGSYEFAEESPQLLDRLYRNDGRGNFSYDASALPARRGNTSCLAAGDYDGDGDLDLFVGGRVVAGKYPMTPASFIWQNEGGRFADVSDEIGGLNDLGMVTSALWTDYDNDDDLDLICVGEWMPVTIFTNDGGVFTRSTLPNSTGWWNSITGGDIDQDGDTDYVLGNLGLNSKNKATVEQPFHVYGDDFDDNGNFDIVLSYYYDGIQYPVRGLQCSSEQIPDIKKKIPSYKEFGSATVSDIYGSSSLAESLHFAATTFSSSLLINEGRNGFELQALPLPAQVAPVTGTLIEDFDADGCPDLLLVGNQYPVEVETGRYDALKGLLLKGNCKGSFTARTARQSGFFVDGDAKAMALIAVGEPARPAVLVSVNQDLTKLFDITGSSNRIEPSTKEKREYYWGSGYLSQSTRKTF